MTASVDVELDPTVAVCSPPSQLLFEVLRRPLEFTLLFTVRMDGEDTLLDARDDLVLLRRLDEFDVPRAVVIQLPAPPGGD